MYAIYFIGGAFHLMASHMITIYHLAPKDFITDSRRSTGFCSLSSSCSNTCPIIKLSFHKIFDGLIDAQIHWLEPIGTVGWNANNVDVVFLQ